ncbi:sodium ion-translocating decarboxylase subunit beta [Xylanivirga thermophila]|uniref:sodium ion-translocating decarboxylase subunit beta n=1 Tax=Xylanivirga thermophila TaxID=2496273 RepID=UPI00101B7D6F|nr:sodium ion-translocating decarboxylase subunit beta [Xylanivirga thermophila]
MEALLQGLSAMTYKHWVMITIGLVLIYLAIKKEYEPMLLLPIGFGAILTNIPMSSAVGPDGFLTILYNVGIKTELFPILIFIAVGAMIDFSPLLKQPVMLFFGAAAQFGIFAAMFLAASTGRFNIQEAAAIGIIGAADGPTSIFVGNKFAKDYLGAITVAAYSYMALVPLIQPPVIRALTTKKERQIRMDADYDVKVSKKVLIFFPIMVTIVAGIVAPMSVALVGSLMFGNLIRECGVLDRLSKSAQNELANLVTLLLGITIGSTMVADKFLSPDTLMILAIGLLAFVFDTAGGVLFAKFVNLFLKKKVNPMIGAAGISAFPMSARIIQKMAQEDDPQNFILMQAIGANVAGQIGSVIAGSVLITLLS